MSTKDPRAGGPAPSVALVAAVLADKKWARWRVLGCRLHVLLSSASALRIHAIHELPGSSAASSARTS